MKGVICYLLLNKHSTLAIYYYYYYYYYYYFVFLIQKVYKK